MAMTEIADTYPEGARGYSRREMFNSIWVGSMVLLSLQMMGVGLYFAMPRLRVGEFGGLFKVGPVRELPSPGDPPLNVPEGKFWLVRTEHHLLALYKACTHLDCMFDWNPQEDKFICPCHGSRFARDGSLLTGPAPRSLDQFGVRILSPQEKVLAQTMPGKGLIMPTIAESNSVSREGGAETATGSPGIPPDAMVWIDTGRKFTGGPAKVDRQKRCRKRADGTG
jgi:cytochrome b6-f complex iron-sulfur subunit